MCNLQQVLYFVEEISSSRLHQTETSEQESHPALTSFGALTGEGCFNAADVLRTSTSNPFFHKNKGKVGCRESSLFHGDEHIMPVGRGSEAVTEATSASDLGEALMRISESTLALGVLGFALSRVEERLSLKDDREEGEDGDESTLMGF